MAYNYAWLWNYLSLSRPCCPRREGYWLSEMYWLALLSRGMQVLCDEERILENPNHVKLCRFVLRRILRFADFQKVMITENSQYFSQIRTAQVRIQGLLQGAEEIPRFPKALHREDSMSETDRDERD